MVVAFCLQAINLIRTCLDRPLSPSRVHRYYKSSCTSRTTSSWLSTLKTSSQRCHESIAGSYSSSIGTRRSPGYVFQTSKVRSEPLRTSFRCRRTVEGKAFSSSHLIEQEMTHLGRRLRVKLIHRLTDRYLRQV